MQNEHNVGVIGNNLKEGAVQCQPLLSQFKPQQSSFKELSNDLNEAKIPRVSRPPGGGSLLNAFHSGPRKLTRPGVTPAFVCSLPARGYPTPDLTRAHGRKDKRSTWRGPSPWLCQFSWLPCGKGRQRGTTALSSVFFPQGLQTARC